MKSKKIAAAVMLALALGTAPAVANAGIFSWLMQWVPTPAIMND